MKTWRSFILKQKYTDVKKSIPLANYQTICIDMQYSQDCIYEESMKSINKIPNFVNLNGNESITINPIGDLFNNIEMTLVLDSRFPFVGNNKWLQNIIYFTRGSDYHIYAKSMNPNYTYLQGIQMSALFDDPVEAAKLSCDDNSGNCNYLDSEYPLEESLIPVLIELVVKELRESEYIPEDKQNNADDNLSSLAVQ